MHTLSGHSMRHDESLKLVQNRRCVEKDIYVHQQ